VLPDNPGIYAILALDNPFPMDWLFPQDLAGSEDRIIASAKGLSRRGDYLVLFQTFSAFELPSMQALPTAPIGPAYAHGTDLGERILETLEGEKIVCGPFTGVYAPLR
jgi:hypothetical protein